MVKIPTDADILPPSDDHIFKTLLTHPDAEGVLMSVVSAVLERRVTAVKVSNNELPISDDAEKNERLDVNCVIDGGDQVNVEMQATRQVELTDDEHKSFKNKFIYYMADVHASQKSKGVKYKDFVRTYQVTFCCHTVFPEKPKFVNSASLRFEDGGLFSDQVNIVVVEMSKLSDALKRSAENLTPLESWSVFFRFAPDPEYRDLINSVITQNKEIGMAATLLMEISQDEHERAKFRSRRKAETDRYSDIATAVDRGRVEVLDLIRKGVSPDEIEKMLNMV
jgi:predicted transposase/invertase (TIGR01784 family)